MSGRTLRVALGVFVILLGSYAFFWHSRDWNVSSRLMLTYALVDRGQVSIDGLEDHTGDRARVGSHYYSDKQPGYSLLAVPPYLACRLLGLPPHPIGRRGEGFAYWPADYWITLATSGVLTASCGALLTILAVWLGCDPGRAALVGLAYGLATPAYVYATLAYGHQATACLLLISLATIERARITGRPLAWATLAGICAAIASVVELQVGPVSALMGIYLLGLVLAKRLPFSSVLGFGLGAAGPTAILLIYNTVTFSSPFDMGYFHEDLAQFRAVHSARNPLGLSRIDAGRAIELLFLPHRGLFFYAPILLLAIPGFFVLLWRRWSVAVVSLGACLAVFLVNLSYPEWTGGMSTGPRLLSPLLPFAMLLVAAIVAPWGRQGNETPRAKPTPWRSRSLRAWTGIAVLLAILGGVEMLMFQGVGGRLPPAPRGYAAETPFHRPWKEIVWPLWKGDPVPRWRGAESDRFEPTLVSLRWPRAVSSVPPGWRWLQFVPLVAFQSASIGLLMWGIKSHPASRRPRDA
ncbi:MAG: hypothetical protein JWN86_2825 [Planctomycetota bacterium]|nr:hypothetical protein [Planctomycetota bacterium]